MLNSAINVSQMHIPPKTQFQKEVGGVTKFFCGHSSRMCVLGHLESDYQASFYAFEC